CLCGQSSSVPSTQTTTIRVNQVGYLPYEGKIAVVQSRIDLRGRRFFLVDAPGDGRALFTGAVGDDHGAYGAFPHDYRLDFSSFSRPGLYRLKLAGGVFSPAFRIGPRLYRDLPQMILAFFRVQRCGNTAA